MSVEKTDKFGGTKFGGTKLTRQKVRLNIGTQNLFIFNFKKYFSVPISGVLLLYAKMTAAQINYIFLEIPVTGIQYMSNNGCDPKRLAVFNCAVKRLTVSFF